MILELGITDYEESRKTQTAMVHRRILGEIGDSLIITEHRPVFTIGRSGGRESLLSREEDLIERGIRVVDVDRGGNITFHGPGQIVLYPIVDLNGRGRDLHRYMRDLESVAIRFLRRYGLDAETIPEKTGVWVSGRKIASIGVGVRHWVAFHGMSINIDVDLSYFNMIHPCGMKDVSVTSLSNELGAEIGASSTTGVIKECFVEIFKSIGGLYDGCEIAGTCRRCQ